MSASEKLKALEPMKLTVKAGVGDPYQVGAMTLYQLPLPQIVAVVEAAERVANAQEIEVAVRMRRIAQDALSALEEALT